jgi:exodeoxyribonuclease III
VRLIAWNILKGGGTRVARLGSALRALEPDVVVLSECRPASAEKINALLGLPYLLAGVDPSGGHTGVAVLTKQPVELDGPTYDDPVDGHRFRSVRVGTGWLVGAAYVPGFSRESDRKQRFWNFLVDTWAPAVEGKAAVLTGDLNTGLHYRDEEGATLVCAERMQQLESAGWRDAWVERSPKLRPPASWWSPGYNNPFRLDHALLSPDAPKAKRVDYLTSLDDELLCGTGGCSDHTPLVVDLRQPVRTIR